MLIAYVTDVFYPFTKGGAERYFYEVSIRLAKKGHEVHVFCVKWWTGKNDIEYEGVFLHSVTNYKRLYIGSMRWPLQPLNFGLSVIPKITQGRFDIIDCNQSPYLHCFPSKIISDIKGNRFVVTWQEVWGNYWYEYAGRIVGFIGKLMERTLAHLPDMIITDADRIREGLIGLGVPGERVKVIYDGIDVDAFREVKPSGEELDIVFLGTLLAYKNVDVLIKASKVLLKWFPDLRVGIIGDGPEAPRLKALAKQLSLEENVKFYGYIDDFREVVALLKSAKVFVHLSSKEGSGIVVQEANAAGLPVIALDHPMGVSKHLIREGYNGLWVKRLDPELVAEKVRMLLEDEDLLFRMRKNALKMARNYSWDRTADEVEKVYNELLSC